MFSIIIEIMYIHLDMVKGDIAIDTRLRMVMESKIKPTRFKVMNVENFIDDDSHQKLSTTEIKQSFDITQTEVFEDNIKSSKKNQDLCSKSHSINSKNVVTQKKDLAVVQTKDRLCQIKTSIPDIILTVDQSINISKNQDKSKNLDDNTMDNNCDTMNDNGDTMDDNGDAVDDNGDAVDDNGDNSSITSYDNITSYGFPFSDSEQSVNADDNNIHNSNITKTPSSNTKAIYEASAGNCIIESLDDPVISMDNSDSDSDEDIMKNLNKLQAKKNQNVSQSSVSNKKVVSLYENIKKSNLTDTEVSDIINKLIKIKK